jgi:hypothetical protein
VILTFLLNHVGTILVTAVPKGHIPAKKSKQRFSKPYNLQMLEGYSKTNKGLSVWVNSGVVGCG